jgi:hypothetical protein
MGRSGSGLIKALFQHLHGATDENHDSVRIVGLRAVTLKKT